MHSSSELVLSYYIYTFTLSAVDCSVTVGARVSWTLHAVVLTVPWLVRIALTWYTLVQLSTIMVTSNATICQREIKTLNIYVRKYILFSKEKSVLKSLMALWLEQVSQWHEIYCHGLEVMSSNPGWVELGVLGTSVLSRTWSKNIRMMLLVEVVPVTWLVLVLLIQFIFAELLVAIVASNAMICTERSSTHFCIHIYTKYL